MSELKEKAKANILAAVKPMVPTSAKFVEGPGYYSFYANNVAFAVNQLDVVLILGEIVDISPAQEVTIERRARVTMNPAQAKPLVRFSTLQLQLMKRKMARSRTSRLCSQMLPANESRPSQTRAGGPGPGVSASTKTGCPRCLAFGHLGDHEPQPDFR